MGVARIGWREWLELPELGIERIKAKVDTGARTSALHAFSVEPFNKAGEDWVRFCLHPLQHDVDTVVTCEAAIKDRRTVSDSGGHREERYVIETTLQLGEQQRQVEVTLTDRESMIFRMLIGRTAMQSLAVDPNASFLLGGDKTTPPQSLCPAPAGESTE